MAPYFYLLFDVMWKGFIFTYRYITMLCNLFIGVDDKYCAIHSAKYASHLFMSQKKSSIIINISFHEVTQRERKD